MTATLPTEDTLIEQINWHPSVVFHPECRACGWKLFDATDMNTAIWWARNHLCEEDR